MTLLPIINLISKEQLGFQIGDPEGVAAVRRGDPVSDGVGPGEPRVIVRQLITFWFTHDLFPSPVYDRR